MTGSEPSTYDIEAPMTDSEIQELEEASLHSVQVHPQPSTPPILYLRLIARIRQEQQRADYAE